MTMKTKTEETNEILCIKRMWQLYAWLVESILTKSNAESCNLHDVLLLTARASDWNTTEKNVGWYFLFLFFFLSLMIQIVPRSISKTHNCYDNNNLIDVILTQAIRSSDCLGEEQVLIYSSNCNYSTSKQRYLGCWGTTASVVDLTWDKTCPEIHPTFYVNI